MNNLEEIYGGNLFYVNFRNHFDSFRFLFMQKTLSLNLNLWKVAVSCNSWKKLLMCSKNRTQLVCGKQRDQLQWKLMLLDADEMCKTKKKKSLWGKSHNLFSHFSPWAIKKMHISLLKTKQNNWDGWKCIRLLLTLNGRISRSSQ